MKHYSSRSNAIRAAKKACRLAMNSPIFSAYEPHDFVISEVEVPGQFWERYTFVLRGPCAEARGSFNEATNP